MVVTFCPGKRTYLGTACVSPASLINMFAFAFRGDPVDGPLATCRQVYWLAR
jgi:hypothetical protein